MSRQMYFVRNCEDNKSRIFRCNLRLEKDRAIIDVENCKYKYGQADSFFRGDGQFIIYFNVSSGLLSLYPYYLIIHGLTTVKDKCFYDGYHFYFSVIEGGDWGPGNF